MNRLLTVLGEELAGVHPRLLLAQILMAPFPPYAGSRLRAAALRLAGFHIGPGVVFWGAPTITGDGDLYSRLHVGRECWFNAGCFLNLGAAIRIGDRVSIGHQAMFLTDTHQLGDATRRAGPLRAAPITIGDGAWLGARCTILPGVNIGAGAIVAAGAVVTRDAPANTLVGGIPAVVLRSLDTPQE